MFDDCKEEFFKRSMVSVVYKKGKCLELMCLVCYGRLYDIKKPQQYDDGVDVDHHNKQQQQHEIINDNNNNNNNNNDIAKN